MRLTGSRGQRDLCLLLLRISQNVSAAPDGLECIYSDRAVSSHEEIGRRKIEAKAQSREVNLRRATRAVGIKE
jgi:hypothetical protein